MFVSWQWRAAWGKPPLLHRKYSERRAQRQTKMEIFGYVYAEPRPVFFKYSERRAQRQTKTQVLWVVVCLLALAPIAVRPQPTEPQPVFLKYSESLCVAAVCNVHICCKAGMRVCKKRFGRLCFCCVVADIK